MDEETKNLIKEELEVSKENNKLLNKLVWYQKWARWFNAIKWIVVVGTTLGALYYIQPLIMNLFSIYSELLGTVSETSIRTIPG